MPASSLDNIKPNTRAPTSTSEEEPTNSQLMAMMRAEFAKMRAELAEQKQQIAELQAARITPAITPAIDPSPTTFPSIRFRADIVCYFDPDLDTDGDRDMVTIRKDLCIRDVFLFTNRLKDIYLTKADPFQSNWPSCLRGTALS
jgi:hypothetical protein